MAGPLKKNNNLVLVADFLSLPGLAFDGFADLVRFIWVAVEGGLRRAGHERISIGCALR